MTKPWPLASLSVLGMLWMEAFSPAFAIVPVAQSPFSNLDQVEHLSNPQWQVVPGAAVGRHPEETLMDTNGIARDGDAVTFDVMGHRGVYYRMEGDCETDQVLLTRRGLSQGLDEFLYESVEPGETEASDWDRRLLAFACQGSTAHKGSEIRTSQSKQNSSDHNSAYLLNTTGVLRSGDQVFVDGSLYHIHPFEGRANQAISITLESSEFNTFLGLISPDEEILGQDGDLSARNLNSTLRATLPRDGTYLVLVKGHTRSSRGRYTLRVQGNSNSPLASSPNPASSPAQPSGSLQAEARPGFRLYRHRNNYSIEYPENWVVDSASSTNNLIIWSQDPSRSSRSGFLGDIVKTEILIDSRPFNADRIARDLRTSGAITGDQVTRRGEITIGGRRALRIWSEGQHGRSISSYIEYSSNQTVEIHSHYDYRNDSWIETIQDIHWSFRKLN